MSLPSTDHALHGFAVIRRHPDALALWGLYFLTVVVFASWITASLAPGAGPDEAAMGLIQRGLSSWSGKLLVALVLFVGNVVLSCAVFRSILRRDDPGFLFLKLGPDEIRVLVVQAVLWLLTLLVQLAVAYMGMVTVFAVAMAGGRVLKPEAAMAMGLAAPVLIIGVFALYVWASVRLSLALPMTFAERRISFSEAWRLSRRHVWAMFFTYLLATIAAVVLVLLVMAAYALAASALGDSDAFRVVFKAGSEVRLLVGSFTPTLLGWALLSIVLHVATMAVTLAPAAEIYRELSGYKAP
jgi:hypothetical protein